MTNESYPNLQPTSFIPVQEEQQIGSLNPATCKWATLIEQHGADGQYVGDIAPSEPVSPFPCRFNGESVTGRCSLPFGPDGQKLPVFSRVGAVRPGGLLPSVPILSSLLI